MSEAKLGSLVEKRVFYKRTLRIMLSTAMQNLTDA